MSKNDHDRSSVVFSLNAKISFKLIVVGDSGVGKTSLIVKYVKNTFSKNHSITLGVQFYSKIVQIQGEEMAMQIWDTAGQQNFKCIAKSFYNQACCVIIAYCDLQLVKKSIEDYMFEINQHASEGVRIVIVRTKVDEIPVSEQEKAILDDFLLKVNNIDFWMEVSSKEGSNIEPFFDKISKNLLTRYRSDNDFKQLVDPKQGSFLIKNSLIREQQQEGKKKGKCCQ